MALLSVSGVGLLLLLLTVWAAVSVSEQATAVASGSKETTVRVKVVIDNDRRLGEAKLSQRASRALRGRLTRRQLTVLRDRSLAAERGSEIARENEVSRQAALRQLGDITKARVRTQSSVAAAIRALGGEIVSVDLLGNSLSARIPSGKVQVIASGENVAQVLTERADRNHGLETSTQAVGAPSFWSSGHTGGRGSKDSNPVDLAILSDKIDETHPAFAGISFQRPAGTSADANCIAIPGDCDHGTNVAGMVISRGVSGIDAAKKGIAPGLDTVLDADPDRTKYDGALWALGLGQEAIGGGSYLAGANDPAEVVSVSYGSFEPGQDDNTDLQGVDALHSQYGLSGAYSVGNEGQMGGSRPSTPCIAYNTICVGGYKMGVADNTTPTDDQIMSASSRGPTPQGRKKPDLVAVGESQTARQDWNGCCNLWIQAGGTSLAAPQVAGGAALLAGSGITDPLAQKAILINSARLGRASSGQPMGTQSGWQADWGWGALDLSAALSQKTNFHAGSVTSTEPTFYSAEAAQGGRTTLVWNRRLDSDLNPIPLTDLNLVQVSRDSGTTQTQSTSTIDNVEQVRSPSSGQVIYKVKAEGNVAGAGAEPYALASASQIRPLAAPKPAVELFTSNPSPKVGETVTLTARITNPSPDLTPESSAVQLNLPAGLELVTGLVSQPLPTLLKSGGSVQPYWQVRVKDVGTHSIALTASSYIYGEQLKTTATVDLSTFQTLSALTSSPGLKIKSLKRLGRTLKITGKFSSKATVKRLALTLKIGKRTYKVKSKSIKQGSNNKAGWYATYKLPTSFKIASLKQVKVTARYSKTTAFRAQTVSKTFRIKASKARR